MFFFKFESTGISKPLVELHGQSLFSQSLLPIVASYLNMVETSFEEELNLYDDPTEIELMNVHDGQELYLEANE